MKLHENLPHYDVICVGNAIMDILGAIDDAFLATHEVDKGGMNLIDQDRAHYLTDALPSSEMQAGGSAANTAYGLAQLGSKTGFVGQVKKDDIGDDFIRDLEAGAVDYLGQQPEDGPATACSIILVTPDTARSMNTFLGSTLAISDAHLLPSFSADVFYLEGYLFDAPAGDVLFAKVAELAKSCGAKLALSLSDGWCVERHFEAMRAFVRDHADIILCNEDEFTALMGGVEDSHISTLLKEVEELVITGGAKGARCFDRQTQIFIDPQPVSEVVDTTGAGDLFAAGYLHARAQGLDLLTRGRIASQCAGEVICHFGARPSEDLRALTAA